MRDVSQVPPLNPIPRVGCDEAGDSFYVHCDEADDEKHDNDVNICLLFTIHLTANGKQMLDTMGPEARAWGENIKKGRQVLVNMDKSADPSTNDVSEAHSDRRSDEEPMGKLSPGKVKKRKKPHRH